MVKYCLQTRSSTASSFICHVNTPILERVDIYIGSIISIRSDIIFIDNIIWNLSNEIIKKDWWIHL